MRLQKREEFEEYSLRQLIEEVIVPIQEIASEKSIKLDFFVENSIDKVFGNPVAMNELFTNLLMNAVKYTPFNGHIELMVHDKGKFIEAVVTDSGIGIPEEDLDNIFDEFYRALNATIAAKAGTGLGLSIVKQIIESHQGSISVVSEPGEWTQFTFVLPKQPRKVSGESIKEHQEQVPRQT